MIEGEVEVQKVIHHSILFEWEKVFFHSFSKFSYVKYIYFQK